MQHNSDLPQDDLGRDAGVLDRALDLVRSLRAGCPWDAAQTPESLTPYLLEEALELVDAIEDGDDDTIRGELGDLLLNVAFQIVLAEERNTFNGDDVVRRLEEKMRRRHPHVFGDAPEPPDWEAGKAHERGGATVEGLARRLDPLSRAQRLQDRAAGVGFDWDDVHGAFAKVREEVEEVAARLEAADEAGLEQELGDLLFACVNVARLSRLHAARALRRANAKFEGRFARLESLARDRGVTMGQASLEELDALWDEIKRDDRISNVD